MRGWIVALGFGSATIVFGVPVVAESPRIEVSSDGHEVVAMSGLQGAEAVIVDEDVPYAGVPDWQNTLRVQVGGLQAADVDLDGDVDLVVGCYHSESYPPYPDWENLIYLNTGAELEASPSWVSADERSTGDIQVALINDDPYPDVFAANGGFEMAASVIYFGGPSGPSTTPGWFAADVSWTNYARPFDVDHDGDIDIVTANQGNSSQDPYRPIYMYVNTAGTLATGPSWQSAETSIQNFLDFGDLDGDGWEDLAVSKWANFESGVYRNQDGSLATVPVWTTGDTDTDKGVGWADADGNGWQDLALGHDPTLVYTNDGGVLTPTWSSAANYFGHSDLRWCDIDRDGDPDLAEVHFSNGQAHIYLNRDGVLDAAPSWSYDSSSVGTAIAFGDINGDSLPDLAIGYSGEPSVVVFYNLGVPLPFADGFESGDTSAWSATVP
jgi:hypothetical protein